MRAAAFLPPGVVGAGRSCRPESVDARERALIVTRLRRSADVRAGLRRGRRQSGALMTVHRLATGRDGARVAVVASRKVGNAVRRNRAKRLLREAARVTELETGYDYVLVARPSCATAALSVVQHEMARLARTPARGRAR